MTNARDAYELTLRDQRLLPGEAVVLLAGEDTAPRVETAVATFRALRHLMLSLMQDVDVSLVVTGGRHQPPRWRGALDLEAELLEREVLPGAIVLDTDAGHTQEQAENVAALVKERGWKRIYLVASTYHIYRAHLTFIKAMPDVRVVPVSAVSAWHEAPEGMTETRQQLFFRERAKVLEYQAMGHVASYDEGLAHLQQWEMA